MQSYNQPVAAPVTVTTATSGNATQAFSTPNANRIGYSVCNLSPSVKVYVQERSDNTVPTAAQVLANPSYILQPEQDKVCGARFNTKIYLATSGTAVDAQMQELV